MLSMGLALGKQDFVILAKRPFDIFVGAIGQFTIMPFLAWAITRVFNLPSDLAVGLILVGCVPGGVSSNIMSFLCHGDLAFSVGMTTASTLIAPVMTPLLIGYLCSGQHVDVDPMGMIMFLLYVTIIPVALGAFLNMTMSKRKSFADIKACMPGVSVIGLACIVGGVVAHHGDKFVSMGLLVFCCIFFHNALGYCLGYVLGIIFRFNTAKKRTISIEVGVQNAGLGTGLAASSSRSSRVRLSQPRLPASGTRSLEPSSRTSMPSRTRTEPPMTPKPRLRKARRGERKRGKAPQRIAGVPD